MLEGPVPTLFSSYPGEAKRNLTASPQLAFECLQALLSRLLARKEITIEEAEEYIQRPVPRAERRPFKMDWTAASSKLPTPSAEPSPGPSSLKDKGTHRKDDFCSGQYSVNKLRSISPKFELNHNPHVKLRYSLRVILIKYYYICMDYSECRLCRFIFPVIDLSALKTLFICTTNPHTPSVANYLLL